MGLIKVLDHVAHCYTNADGDKIRHLITDEIQKNNKVALSFDGVDSVSSSFLNSALIDLLDVYNFEQIKRNIIFVDSSKAINDAIKRRFTFEVNEKKAPWGLE